MSQSNFQLIRQNFAKQARKQQLERRFAQKRQKLSVEWAQREKEIFQGILPNINQNNYEQQKSILSDYARSSTYSYELLPIAFIAYNYLLRNSLDSSSWQIITYLSFYEDFEIPQTKELVQMMVKYLFKDPQLISELILNLSKLPKCSLICCRLIDAQIVNVISEKLHQLEDIYFHECNNNKSEEFRGKNELELQIYNFLFTLSHIFAIQPTLNLYQMEKICSVLRWQTKSNKFLKQVHTEAIFNLITNTISNLSHQSKVINLLMQSFEQNVFNGFFMYEQQSMRFLQFCVKNKVLLTKRLIKNILIDINSKQNKSKIASLRLLKKILNSTEEAQKMEVQQQTQKLSNLQTFIDNKISLSLEEFNTMYTSNRSQPKQKVSQISIKNCFMLQALLFTQNYEYELKNLFEMFQNSNEKIQQEIALFIQSIIKCLIRQIHQSQPKRIVENNVEIYVTENMDDFIYQTVEQSDFYLFVGSCLKSLNISLIRSALQILSQVVVYFQYQTEEFEQRTKQINIDFVVSQLQKFNILSEIEHLLGNENKDIRNSADDLLSVIDQKHN